MNQRQFPFAVERFGYDAGLGIHRAEAVIGKVRAARRIHANQQVHLLKGIRKAPLG